MKVLQNVKNAFNFAKNEAATEFQVRPSFWTSGEAELHVPHNLMHFELPSAVNEKPDVQHQMEKLCAKKAELSFARLCFLGLLSGVWMVLSASCALTAAAGISPEVVNEWPIISKFVLSIFAPVAMHFIVVFGGEFFSGNCMYFCVGLLKKRVTIQQSCFNLFWVFVWNALGCVSACYFCLYLTQIFAGDMERRYVIQVAESKARMSWTTSFLRAIPANILICTSIQMGIAARDMAGKIAVLHFPLTMYTVAGFEHCITNLVVVPLGIMYGADVDMSEWLWNNLLPSTLGNFIGGGGIVGGF
uniref:Formate/nitrite transporter n=1 Tax=Hemiselmis tepida TaxID=464990 RepID=A0A7S0W793_9CRYP|mmetsp:Transcript_38641/g.98782  ORF Transcript_38641/g.98782 Transcript_38641/m.98782 type:complete len:302 (+) Transcript_38641:110-1015(+)